MFACPDCGQVLTSNGSLKYHVQYKPRTCDKHRRRVAAAHVQSTSAVQVPPALQSTPQRAMGEDEVDPLDSPALLHPKPSLSSPPELLHAKPSLTSPRPLKKSVPPLTPLQPDAPTNASDGGSSPVNAPEQMLPSASVSQMSFAKAPEKRELLPGEVQHRTPFDTDGYCWFTYSSSRKRQRHYDTCRSCLVHHISDPSHQVGNCRGANFSGANLLQ